MCVCVCGENYTHVLGKGVVAGIDGQLIGIEAESEPTRPDVRHRVHEPGGYLESKQATQVRDHHKRSWLRAYSPDMACTL